MRQFGLILENLDGFDQPGVMRCVPHLFSLNLTVQPRPDNVAKAGFGDSTGWSGDGQALELPGGVTTNGTLREFTIGAVFQHFPKTLKRVPDEDFRLPTDEELVAIEAFLRSLVRQNEIDLDGMTFQSPVVEQGKILFNSTAKCFMCYENAGAINFNSVNGNANTGIEDQIGLPNKLIDPTVPRDGGFGVEPDGMDGLGDGTFSVPPLIEAADTPPFFHNNSVNTIEAAVGFYNSRAFNDSPAGQFVGGISLDGSQVVAIASLLRMLNALENIRLSNVQDEKAKAAKLHRGRELLAVSIADTQDAIEVLTGGEFFLYRRAVGLLKETLFLEKFARHVGIGRRNRLLDRAIRKKEEARALIVDEG